MVAGAGAARAMGLLEGVMARPQGRLATRRARAEEAFRAGRLEEAARLFGAVCKATPRDPEARRWLARCVAEQGDFLAAERHWRAVVGRLARDPEGWAGVGLALHHQGRVIEAAEAYRRSLELYPAEINTHENLAAALSQAGRAAEAVAVYRHGLAVAPGHARLHSSLLLCLHYLEGEAPETLLEEHRRWGAAHGGGAVADPFANLPDPERRLRVGYVSADFCEHSVASFFLPLVERHDRARFEIVCYSAAPLVDRVTEEIRGLADHWVEISAMVDGEAAKRIRRDRVDVLVDLSGHTASNRLTLFARRPAPVQVTYLGYPDTTGLLAMDYRLVDGVTDPPGAERWATERLLRLPDCFLCYRPPAGAPAVAEPPLRANGHVTFGSFNNLAKVNDGVVEAWAEILRRSPGAHLVVKSSLLDDPATGEALRGRFLHHGVAPERVELLARQAARAGHLACYSRIDIGLDTFPYNGTTTTCEALWQGVPVVTLAGGLHMGRVGASLLRAVGLGDWVAGDVATYVERAVALAADRERLAALRRTLRATVAASPLCAEATFTRQVETAYRTAWQAWCTAR